MASRGLTNHHFIPQGQTVTAGYYISNILDKEVKTLLSRRSTAEEPVKRKLFSSNKSMTFIQDGVPAHTTQATQKNMPHFIEKSEWPANLPDLNPVENLWSIICEVAYRDQVPKTMGELKTRLHQAWRNVPLMTLQELAHSMPRCIKNVQRACRLLILFVKTVRTYVINL